MALTVQEMQQRVGMRPTLLIGLGGTGQKVLIQLKAHFMRVYGQVPPAVEFLCFDTDQTAELTEYKSLLLAKNFRFGHNRTRIVMKIKDMSDLMKITAAGTVYKTEGIFMHSPVCNLGTFKLAPCLIEWYPDNDTGGII